MNVEEQQIAAARACVAKVLAEEVTREVKKARDLLEPTMRAGSRVVAVLPDGAEVGAVVKAKRSLSVVVTDEAALLAYVERARPDEVITTKAIRPAFRTWLLEEAKRQLTEPDGPGVVVDADGEVVPGIELVPGSSSYRPDVSAEGRRVIHERLARLLGAELAAVLTLPAGGAR